MVGRTRFAEERQLEDDEKPDRLSLRTIDAGRADVFALS